MQRRPRTPRKVKLALAAALLVVAGWLIADRIDRRGNERRLGAVASGIVGHRVAVRCPGPLARVFTWEISEGRVRFAADGTPADETRLSAGPCDALDAIAEGRAGEQLACIERIPDGWCGEAARTAARAVETLAHESWHMRGVSDEAATECYAMQTLQATGVALGLSPAQGRAIAVHQLANGYDLLPDSYQSAECRDGGRLDLRPGDPAWP